MRLPKWILSFLLAIVLLFGVASVGMAGEAEEILAGSSEIVICIDAGHGGDTEGAKYDYDGITVLEKDINLQIALKLWEELSQYENVRIVMTRTEDITIELKPRVQFAVSQGADYLISVHNNACGNGDLTLNGCMVLATVSHYQAAGAKLPDIYEASGRLGLAIVNQLQRLGIALGTELGAQVNGLVRRPYSPEGNARTTNYYPDGSVADYYALIRFGVEEGLPAVIIEHAYLSSEQDYRAYLKTEESIAALARADAQGIAEALSLVKKPEEAPAALEPVKIKMPMVLPKALQKGAQNFLILKLQ